MMNTFTAVVHKEEDLYVAECPEVGTANQGETIEDSDFTKDKTLAAYFQEIIYLSLLFFIPPAHR